ncbi:DUF2058 domain-containing protein [Granulosicoccus antarcticus]|uniref:Nucleoprotein/polynucleotide-associated enzyme n=1 Tax=Granulosicoccus antarcticus IMCC3135 TaxID=1192854 RepID=A0A2Z2NQ82_9GAMM|nr:DUF2058 domain-containing protein [Granulosicoccus antarcticus]ASJ72131.1 hypothetical protein IMCC3135_10185 [Granulosicoccus antarcticus IMCC3135]
MAKSLQEQLRQAGIASQKQVVSARKAQNTKEKKQRKGQDVVDETADLVKQRDAETLARDKALNEERDRAADQKAVQAQIQQIIELNAIAERGDTQFGFDHGGVIKSLMLQSDHRQALIRGALAIVGKQDQLSIVPRQAAEKIAERDESWLVVLNTRDENAPDADDEYAGYEVPDDLMW